MLNRDIEMYDSKNDIELKKIIDKVSNSLKPLTNESERIILVATMICNIFGGIEFDSEHLSLKCNEIIEHEFKTNNCPSIYIGKLMKSGFGYCSHRSLLFKYIADATQDTTKFGSPPIEARVIRGSWSNEYHAWNIVKINGKHKLLDLTSNTTAIKFHDANSNLIPYYARIHGTAGINSINEQTKQILYPDVNSTLFLSSKSNLNIEMIDWQFEGMKLQSIGSGGFGDVYLVLYQPPISKTNPSEQNKPINAAMKVITSASKNIDYNMK
jgi:hypothetical protein